MKGGFVNRLQRSFYIKPLLYYLNETYGFNAQKEI